MKAWDAAPEEVRVEFMEQIRLRVSDGARSANADGSHHVNAGLPRLASLPPAEFRAPKTQAQ